MKRVLFITGTRADYSKVEPLAFAIKDHFSIGFFITGMHLKEKFGFTDVEVKRFPANYFYEFDNNLSGDASLQMILSETIKGLEGCVQEYTPDLIVIHGDRVEAFAASIFSAFAGIRSVHIEGGEVSGSIDEQLRHCNTKLCGKHFLANASARDRVLRLGEQPDTIYEIGSPELDLHGSDAGITFNEVRERYGVPFESKDYGILIYHPVDNFTDRIFIEAKWVFESIMSSGKNFVLIYPNNDPGSSYIFNWIDSIHGEQFVKLPSMRASHFSVLLKNSALLVGNSSAGVREAPFLGLPSINIGNRQQGRNKSESIIDVDVREHLFHREIVELWNQHFPRSTAFGAGNAGAKFLEILSREDFWDFKFPKLFYDADLSP